MSSLSLDARRRILAAVWAAVGAWLFLRGLAYAGFRPVDGVQALSGGDAWLALGMGLALGLLKGLTVMRRAARRAVARQAARGDTAPLWTVLEPRMLLLVATMVGAGLLLRLAPYDAHLKAWLVGTLYPAIGLALAIAGAAVALDPAPQRA